VECGGSTPPLTARLDAAATMARKLQPTAPFVRLNFNLNFSRMTPQRGANGAKTEE
jgi:hypothetical protein